jgi:hypothetical protein
MAKPRFIVAEISKTWVKEETDVNVQETVSCRFELVIAHNLSRGYLLHSWRFAATTIQGFLVETIVAVFERSGGLPDEPPAAGNGHGDSAD